MENISLLFAFVAGLLSFLLPCVLPLVPIYLASLCGPEIFEPEAGKRRLTVFFHSLSFVIGFTVVFATLGAGAGLAGFALSSSLMDKIAGGLLIAFGLFMLAALKIPWLNYERRLNISPGRTTGYLRSLLVGAVFSVAWTPCVGPMQGTVLTFALTEATPARGALLLAVYSLGLGLPFLAIGAAFDFLLPVIKHINRYSRIIYFVSGLLLIAVGILILTGKLALLSVPFSS
jgi:cytochrome c-type biogenesis protein